MGYVLKNLNLIDGTGGPVVNNAVVVVEGTKIKAVGKEGEVEYPADYEVLDLGGKTVLPGMVEAHVHIGMNGEPAMETIMLKETLPMTTIKASVYAQRDLMAGFTTIRTMGDKGFLDVALKKSNRRRHNRWTSDEGFGPDFVYHRWTRRHCFAA